MDLNQRELVETVFTNACRPCAGESGQANRWLPQRDSVTVVKTTVLRSVSLTPPQLRWLNEEAARLSISIGELVRRIIDAHRERASRGDKVSACPGLRHEP